MTIRSDRRSDALRRPRRLALGAVLLAAALPALGAAPASAATGSAERSAAAFSDLSGRPAPARRGATPEITPRRFRALELDRPALAGVLDEAPVQGRSAARSGALTVSLPAPDGSTQRFAVRSSSVLDPALAAEHPEIATYSGVGIDEPGATVRLDLTPLGFHASVRGPEGAWYVDPYYRRDQSVYASYRGDDLVDGDGPFRESQVPPPPDAERRVAAPRPAGAFVPLRTYRLALLSDPTYAAYFGSANVTAAKTTLISRVNQIYEDDFAIRLQLIGGTDALNLDTDAKMTGANGPCGSAPCYSATEAEGCTDETLSRTSTVLGQLAGAATFDVGHLALGRPGGGLAGLGVVGTGAKAQGCTGDGRPVGDLFAVDYVAHELGHQFAGNHTFNGLDGSCGGNIAGTAVEPGSGSTVMAYAGICGTDDLQTHSDPYFSQRSIDEITTYVDSDPVPVDELQGIAFRNFGGTDAFRITYDGRTSDLITRGTNYTAGDLRAEIEALLPVGAEVAIYTEGLGDVADSASPGTRGFSIAFGASVAGEDLTAVGIVPSVAGSFTASVGEIAKGGPSRNGGDEVVTANHAPTVAVPAAVTIPARTPFTLSGVGTDVDNDALTYSWEQNDSGAGKALFGNAKKTGPLFRVFGTAAQITEEGTILSPSPGQNAAGTSPTRDFPDLAQVVAGNTNAETGACPSGASTAAAIDCSSEFLPTAAYTGAAATPEQLHFRLTARDGNPAGGGVAHADTTVTLAPGAGPFRALTPGPAAIVIGGTSPTATWDVANTTADPVGAANVRISLSTDGGLTFPTVLVASTPNDGSAPVPLPDVATTSARLKIEAIGKVFYDVSHGDFTITKAVVPDPTPTPTPTPDPTPTPTPDPTPPPSPSPSPNPTPTPSPTPNPTPGPAATSRLAPVLTSVPRLVRLSRAGRVPVTLRCKPVGAGSAPARCAGTLRLTARIGGRSRTIGTARFGFARASKGTLLVKLTPFARKRLRVRTRAVLAVTVTSGSAPRSTSKTVTLVPRRR